MLDRLFGFKIHHYLQALGLFILAVGLPLNKVLMSIGTIWLAANLLLKANLKGYWKSWKSNFVFWFIALTLILHVFGLVYTEDFSYAFRDFNTKLPLFVIPIALIAFPIEKRFFNIILYGFIASLIITSVINYSFMMNNTTSDYREFSLFGSHIRYALLIVTGILISVYFWIKQRNLWFVYLGVCIWFLYYTLISQVFSGYVALVFLFLGLFIFFIKKVQSVVLRNLVTIIVLGSAIAGGALLFNYLRPTAEAYVFGELPQRTEDGAPYYHDTTVLWFENGHHVTSYLSGEELKSSWQKRSSIDFYTVLDNGYQLKNVLILYMTSKGLTKDKAGMLQMTDQDIENVENGISSIIYTYGMFKMKLAELNNIIYHYSIDGDPDGSSLLQRAEHWKAGIEIIREHWVLGVGTGDVQEAFNDAYRKSNTLLDKDNWNRAHNQFMTFWITFGIFGFVLFTGFWLWFLRKNILVNNLLGIGFTLIAIASFLSEDTLETQQGVTYISLFLGLCTMMNKYYLPVKDNN